jgi:hypothetical protein
MLFRKQTDADLLGKGEGVAHGLKHYYKKEQCNNRFNLKFLDWVYDFIQSFMKRKAINESRASRFGKKFGDFADSTAKNFDEASKNG